MASLDSPHGFSKAKNQICELPLSKRKFQIKLDEFLDAITQHGNVKYVFSGHVHAGVKASVKSSVTYRGTQFINSPTAVKGRPFGEEYTAFENDPSNPDYRLGYFLEVVVNDDEVSLIGHKISHPHQVVYPVQMPVFSVHSDPRFFSPESHLVANEFIKNPDFSAGQSGWYTTHRYQKDNQNAFTNLFSQGVNHQKLVAPWGDWTFDEYLETFQVVKMDPKQANQLRYHFVTPTMSSQGSGGFIRINFFLQSKRKFGTLLLHWGKQENQLKFSDKAWAYNATGDRANYDYLNREIKAGHTLSMPLAFEHAEGKQLLQLNLNALLPHFGRSGLSVKNISHMTLAHGVWTIIKITGEPIASELKMDAIHLTHNKKMNAAPITLNGKIIPLDGKDRKTPYGSTKPRGQ